MKKVIVALIVFIVIFLLNGSLLTFAEHSGGGGDFGTPHQESEYQEDTVTEEEAGGMLMQVLQFLFFGGTPITAYIIYERKLSKSARASKKIMKMLDQKDSIWKFKNIMPRFKQIFNIIKAAKIQNNFNLAKPYATDEIINKLKMQQIWAERLNKYCSISRIKLLDARPVAVFDCDDDNCDHIWFYIEWSALESTGKYGSSKTLNEYKEFWQLNRCNDEWILSDILDKETGDKLIFGEEVTDLSNNNNN